jgi:malate synthase
VQPDEILNVGATPGEVTEAGLRGNISVALQYLASWLRGTGAVAIANLMEDAATAEICRSQIWQWVHHKVTLPDGSAISAELVNRFAEEELLKLGDGSDYEAAWQLFREVSLADDFPDFLTVPAYERMP